VVRLPVSRVGGSGRVQPCSKAERNLTEERLRDRDELVRVLTEHANDFIRVHDIDGRSVYASPSVLRLYGREPATMFELAHPEDAEACRRWWGKVVADGTIALAGP
jgi:two-component system, cell cycle sensor histidine kinase and response regulator CckA